MLNAPETREANHILLGCLAPLWPMGLTLNSTESLRLKREVLAVLDSNILRHGVLCFLKNFRSSPCEELICESDICHPSVISCLSFVVALRGSH